MIDRDRVRIEVAGPAESRPIAALHHIAHSISFRTFADPEWIQARSLDEYEDFWRDYLSNQAGDERTWVAYLEADIVGTVTIMALSNSSESFRPSWEDGSPGKVACLRLMYVHPDHQRKGIGRMLMSQAVDFMQKRGYESATLVTHAANEAARNFYEQAGWRLDAIFEHQVEEFFEEPASMRKRARYAMIIDQ